MASGLQALCLVARLHQVAGEPAALAHHLGLGPSSPVGVGDLLRAARHLGLKPKHLRVEAARLPLTPLPALALMHDGSVAVLAQCDGQRVLLQRFGSEGVAPTPPLIEPMERFAGQWSGELILIASRVSLAGELRRFDFSWFIPSLVKHRRLLLEVLGVSLLLQLFALVSPLFFQVVMDKVLVHRADSTLNVLVVGLVIVVVFESVLTALRTYVFSHTTSRIDVELGARLYRHLLQLPLAYFQARRVGDTVARVRELEQIRAFLTGNALTLVLDLAFSVVFVAVMFFYSVPLTLAVLATLPIYAAVSLMLVPVLRHRLDEKFARGAENQALLVETVTAVQTVKAGALEPQMARRWDDQLAAYVSASVRAGNVASLGHEAVQLTSKLANAALLWFGAHQVMEGALTVGMFVAFNMFAGRVSQPVLRIAQMWSDFQQTGLSMRRLADVLDTRGEALANGAAAVPTLQGHIQFERVSFRYRPEASPVLHELSLALRPGEVLGVVGRSGSGKSTLAKLIQRLYVPEQGRVRVDGLDLALIDPAALRRQIGVVLQENQLFNRSVRENIAIADPAAPLERVIAVARLAGAHEFISELPEGYDTSVGEQGTRLSGGQRQRIAIARALFTDPRILIFDEATSALDYESEAAVQANMAAICRGRTVIIIAHRLSAVRPAHRIISLHEGRIVEMGSHAELLQAGGLYAHLWRLQSGPGDAPRPPTTERRK
ncbi:MAG: type I secretion system permease/ATPase [Vitreoscilla sp.]|nr:type I secretion system permease/ATPase [Vitreoscilla sp.]